MQAKFDQITSAIESLDAQNVVFKEQDKDDEKADYKIQQFKHLKKYNPHKANQVINPRAADFMFENFDDKLPSHIQTIEKWHHTWGIN